MREILFRGKRVDNGEWIEGNYEWYHKPPKHIISNPYTGETKGVILETVGQYTGLKDKNGTKIFEGDIARDNDGFIGTIVYGSGSFCYEDIRWNEYLNTACHHIKVIGNIYDNPELLEEQEEDEQRFRQAHF